MCATEELDGLTCPACTTAVERLTEAPDGEQLCATCMAEQFVACADCGDLTARDDSIERDGTVYCAECHSDRFAECRECWNVCEQTAMVDIDGDLYCDRCHDEHFTRCHDCGMDVHHDNTRSPNDADHHSFCEECYDNLYYCGECGYHYESGSCPDCDGFGGMEVQDYSYKPRRQAFQLAEGETAQADTLYLGVELEIETEGNTPTRALREALTQPWLYLKHDGSLHQGVEIVTTPLSRAWVMANRAPLNAMLRELRAAGMESDRTGTCGMHVHLSREAFRDAGHLYRFMRLLYEDPQFTFAVSGRRDAYELAQWAGCDTTATQLVEKAHRGYNTGNRGRYTAVNLDNPHTVEVRIFKGTIETARFWRNVEFLIAAFDFAATADVAHTAVLEFNEFVQARVGEFPHFAEFLQQYVDTAGLARPVAAAAAAVA